MSLSKVQSTEDNYRRDSFSDRVCDDLSEVILQYLLLEDKLRLEWVSHQFQKTVFQKHKRLDIYHIFETHQKQEKDTNLAAIESVLKKCPNIKIVILNKHCVYKLPNTFVDPLTDLIFKYCHNLTQISDFPIYNDNNWNKFLQIIDSKSFTIDTMFPNPYIYESLAFVKELQIHCYLNSLSQMIGLKNLKKVTFDSEFETINDFLTLIQNIKSLKYIEIRGNNLDSNELNDLFKQISKLNDLIELKIPFSLRISDKSLKQMSFKCDKLKKFSFGITNNSLTEVMSTLKSFKFLKELDISLYEPLFSFKLFQGLQGLTHLNLKIHSIDPNMGLTSRMLRDIEVVLPKLRSLKIRPKLNACFSKAHILSRLLNLEKLSLYVDNHFICQLIEEKLNANCRRIHWISFC